MPPRQATEMYRNTASTFSPLTKLYSDAKLASQNIVSPRNDEEPTEVQSLHRKFRIQKDRLLAWGFDWSDTSSADGDIDASVQRAGLTEVVHSVLDGVTETMDQVAKLRKKQTLSPAGFPLEKAASQAATASSWAPDDQAQYADLVRDLTSSLDLLCDLSKSKRSDFQMVPSEKQYHDEKKVKYDESFARSLPQYPQEKSGPSSDSGSLKLSRSAIIMPEETPPPYDTSGIPSPVRIVGRLRTGMPAVDFKGASHPTSTRSVLIEYASFDALYQGGVPLPFTRVQDLAGILQDEKLDMGLMKLIGYFEDDDRPRIGLVYELPSIVPANLANSSLAPVTLQNLLQNSVVRQNESVSAFLERVPALEHRFQLAHQVLMAVSILVTNTFTHRDLNSNSIIFFPSEQQSASFACNTPNVSLREPVLSSFDLFSEYNLDAPTANLHQNMYRHPQDPRLNGSASSTGFQTRFDMYSLGLILLEIGLWTPLSHMFKDKYSLEDFRLRVERIWVKKLGSRCSTPYMRAVQDCMNAPSAQASAEQNKHILERALARLQRCCLLFDEDDVPSQSTNEASTAQSAQQGMISPPVAEPEEISQPMEVTPTPRETVISQHIISPRARTRQVTSNVANKKIFPDEYLPQAAIDKFQSGVEDYLVRLVQKGLPIKESCSISLELFGYTRERARPTIMIECKSVKRLKALIKSHFKYDTETFDIAVLSGSILRSKMTKPSKKSKAQRSQNADGLPAKNPFHYERPVCGASIGAWQDLEHSPAASFGGIVLVDGEPYGMSVHHLLEPAEVDEDDASAENVPELTRSSAKANVLALTAPSAPVLERRDHLFESFEDSQIDSEDDDDAASEDFDFPDNISEISDSDLDGFHEGDTAGIDAGEGEEIIITQPALSDVAADFFPNDEDVDDEHLMSHTLGHVHASSGLRRLTHDSVDHEIDWALFKLKDERLQPVNLIAGGRRYSKQSLNPSTPLRKPVARHMYKAADDLYPQIVAPSSSNSLSGLSVHCFGRTSGLASGVIGRSMQLVRLPGRSTFTKSWTVSGGNFGQGGDSGAWVADEQGRICGHVLAWSESMQRAYIAPMDVLFEDIRRTLGAAVVCLPGENGTTWAAEEDEVPMLVGGRREAGVDTEGLRLTPTRSPSSRSLLSDHMLLTGNETPLGREWSRRRATLGLC